MKINSITMNTGYLKGRAAEHSERCMRECVDERNKSDLKLNNEQINTTIKMNSDGRVNFKGAVAAKAPFLHSAAKFAYITCGIRPLTIMATAKNEEDKEKCSYQAAKSISSGLVGLAFTALVTSLTTPAIKKTLEKGKLKIPSQMKEQSKEIVKSGVEALNETVGRLVAEGRETDFVKKFKDLVEPDKINLGVFKKLGKNSKKQFEEKISEIAPEILEKVKAAIKAQKNLDNYEHTAKNVIDKLFQPIFMIIRANVTIALVPVILGVLGLSKNKKAKNVQKDDPYENLIRNTFQSNSEKELFKSFTGVNENASK